MSKAENLFGRWDSNKLNPPNLTLQTKIKAPRESSDDYRVAKTDRTTIIVSAGDSKVYRLLDDKDAQKFRLTDEKGDAAERRKVKDMETMINLIGGKTKSRRVTASSRSPIKVGTLSKTKRVENKAFDDSNLSPTKSTKDKANTSVLRESLSAGSTKIRISDSLIEDQKKFIQKQQDYKLRESLKQQEAEVLEAKERERLHRATLVDGNKFKDLFDRQVAFKMQAYEKIEGERARIKAQEEKERIERRKARLEHIKRSSVDKDETTWKEMEEIADNLRKERIRKRKAEVAQNSSFPSCAIDLGKKTEKTTNDDALSKGFKAEDPDKVASRLAKYQKEWKLKEKADMAMREEKDLERSVQKSKTQNDPFVAAMEAREKKLALKRKERLDEQQRQRDDADKRKAEEERKKREKLLEQAKQQLPEESRHLTDQARKKAQLAKERIMREKMYQEEEERIKKEKLRKSKEVTAVIKVIIDENEHEKEAKLKIFNDKRMELRNSQPAYVPAAKREEERSWPKELPWYRKNPRPTDRPSLMRRHDTKVVARDANAYALKKVDKVIEGVAGNDKYNDVNDYEDDFFDESEKPFINAFKK